MSLGVQVDHMGGGYSYQCISVIIKADVDKIVK